MTDHKELRRLAAAIEQQGWRLFNKNGVYEVQAGKDYAVVHWTGFDASDLPQKHVAAFIAAANPKAVTALLDELDVERRSNEAVLLANQMFTQEYEKAYSLLVQEKDRAEKAVAERDQLRAASGTLVGHIIGVQVFLQSLGTPLAHDLVKLGTVAIKDATEALTTPLPAAATPERQFFNMDGSPRYYPEDSKPAADSVQVRTPETCPHDGNPNCAWNPFMKPPQKTGECSMACPLKSIRSKQGV